MTDADEDRAQAAEFIRYDWLTDGRSTLLHYADLTPEQIAEFAVEWGFFDGITFLCGREAKWAGIPGVFTRMGARRCPRCCDAAGMPRGKGSPKNDPECRRALGLDDGRTL